MNLQEEIKIMKERIAELEELAKEEQEFPQDGDKYWYMDDEGAVFCEFYNHYIDKYHQEIGNSFRTEEEAEFAVEKLKVEVELRKYSDSWNLEKTQRTFSLNWETGKLEVEYPDYNQFPNSYYFDSINGLRLAIETVGEERIKKYIFGVEEE